MQLSRRNILIGLGGIVAGGGALVGTGAFTTVQAERTVTVETAGDETALLALAPTNDPNGDYATINDGRLEVEITNVNLNAVTHIDNVFQITNNGTRDVVLYFEEDPGDDNPSGNAIDVGAKTDELADTDPNNNPSSDGINASDVVDISHPNPPDSDPTYEDIGVLLRTGDTLKVGFYIDTSDDNPNDGLDESGDSDVEADEALMENLTIHADAEEAENSNHRFTAASGT